jgi:hypothetical protein
MIFGTPTIVTNGLILYLDAGNRMSYLGSGTAWRDLGGNGYNNTLTGGPTFATDNLGSILFNGTTQYAIATNFPDLVAAGDFTITAWFRTNSTVLSAGSNRRLLNQRTASSNAITIIQGSATANGLPTNTYAVALLASGVSTNITYTGTLIQADTWYQATVTRTVATIGAYLNGVKGANTVGSGILDGTAQTTTLNIGRSSQGVGFWSGNIAQVLIHSRVLSQQEITQNYNATKNRFGLS